MGLFARQAAVPQDSPPVQAMPAVNNEDIDAGMKRLVEQIAVQLVDNPQLVRVDSVTGGQICVLELHVAKEDVGKVIGRQGKTANAIRLLLAAAANKNHRRMIFRIVQ